MQHTIRDGRPTDLDAILALLPRLADFELPPHRQSEDLWHSDAMLIRAWSRGEAPSCRVKVAINPEDRLLGAAVASLRKEMLSGAPSAHLEVLVIHPSADGHGVGRDLLRDIEGAVQQEGATSLTLHVFANNVRARHVYDQMGYAGEIMRYIRHF